MIKLHYQENLLNFLPKLKIDVIYNSQTADALPYIKTPHSSYYINIMY